jgi:hypothetical protein
VDGNEPGDGSEIEDAPARISALIAEETQNAKPVTSMMSDEGLLALPAYPDEVDDVLPAFLGE